MRERITLPFSHRVLAFAYGALVYPLMEIGCRGHSHWSMAIAGGIGLNLLLGIHCRNPYGPLRRKCLNGALAITALEFISGCIVNKWLHLSVWDYSHLPGNIMGQICLPFTLIWFFLSIPIFALITAPKLSPYSRRAAVHK